MSFHESSTSVRPRSLAIGILITALALLATGVGNAAAQWPPGDNPYTPGTAAFALGCPYVGSAPFDPIVNPGANPGSHMHDFLGNNTINPSSTTEDLASGSSTSHCTNAADHSAYWFPSLYQRQLDGTMKQLKTIEVTIYYTGARWGDHEENAKYHPIPEGLVMITGNAQAQDAQTWEVQWKCANGNPRPGGGPNCIPGGPTGVFAFLTFPNCWNGQLDSWNHKDHLKHVPAYQACPLSHPTKIANIQLVINYYHTYGGPDAETDPSPGAVKLSSATGAGDGKALHSMHADFMNGWDQTELERIHMRCITLSTCGVKPPSP